MIDITDCEQIASDFEGSERKFAILYNGEPYMVKEPDPVRDKNNLLSYMNNTFSEHIGCKIFEMLDCIASGNKDRALVLYNNLIALKEAPIKILSLITRHYNILYKLYYANKSNVSSNDAASSIGIPPFTIKKYSYQLKKYNGEKLKNILNTCLEIDEKSKSGRIDPQIGVEILIVSLF